MDGAERRARVERRAGRLRGIRLPEEHARRGDGEVGGRQARRRAAQSLARVPGRAEGGVRVFPRRVHRHRVHGARGDADHHAHAGQGPGGRGPARFRAGRALPGRRRRRRRPRGPYYHRHGGLDGDFWFYLYMRDIMWFTYWNEHDHRRHLYATGAYGDQSDAVRGDANAKPGRGGRRPGGGGGGGPNPNGGGGPNGDPPFGGDPSGGPPAGDPSDLRRFVAEEDRDDATSRGLGSREMTFIESVFAFVFGRGDPNDDMEHRRWRAVSALLRVNRGAVFAEQVAPFLDEYLLGTNVANASDTNVLGSIANGITNTLARLKSALAAVPSLPLPAATRRAWRLGFESRRDGAADAARMHEGYMTSVCARFGGHAEASEDGRLVYVFPALTVTTIDEENTPSRPALLPPRFPPAVRAAEAGMGRRRESRPSRGARRAQPVSGGAVQARRRRGLPRARGGRWACARARHDGAARGGGARARVSDGARVAGTGARVVGTAARITNRSSELARRRRRLGARAPRWRRRGRRVPTWTPPRAPRVGRSCTRPCLW